MSAKVLSWKRNPGMCSIPKVPRPCVVASNESFGEVIPCLVRISTSWWFVVNETAARVKPCGLKNNIQKFKKPHFPIVIHRTLN